MCFITEHGPAVQDCPWPESLVSGYNPERTPGTCGLVIFDYWSGLNFYGWEWLAGTSDAQMVSWPLIHQLSSLSNICSSGKPELVRVGSYQWWHYWIRVRMRVDVWEIVCVRVCDLRLQFTVTEPWRNRNLIPDWWSHQGLSILRWQDHWLDCLSPSPVLLSCFWLHSVLLLAHFFRIMEVGMMVVPRHGWLLVPSLLATVLDERW